jgi:TonB-linked SusC/RagA family outer membrane protein
MRPNSVRNLLAGAVGLLAVLLIGTSPVHAQAGGNITGVVTNQSTNQPVQSAQIFIAGTQRGGLTNQQGRYLIANVPPGEYEVRATLIGYSQAIARVTVVANQTAQLDLRLSESAITLGAVIVTATGTEQRTREIGNAVSTINVADLPQASTPTLTNLLQSRAPGVTVAPASGSTGMASRIRIRGSNSVSLSNEPLVIIDGVRVSSAGGLSSGVGLGGQSPSRLDDITPDQIESIEVLKGPAAAALYGTAAANGVIQITTRRGRAGAARWSLYTEQGTWQDNYDYPAAYRSEAGLGASGLGGSCVVYDVAMGNCRDTGGNVLSEVPGVRSFNALMDPRTRPFETAHRQQYGLNVSGGNEGITYFVMGEMTDESGVLPTNALERYSTRANLNIYANEKLDFALRTGYTSSALQLPGEGNNTTFGLWINALLGTGDFENNRGFWTVNDQQMFAFDAGQDVNRFNTSLTGTYRILPWLQLTGTGGVDDISRHDFTYLPPNTILNSANNRLGTRRSNRVAERNITATSAATANYALTTSVTGTTSVGGQYNQELYRDTRAFGVGMAPGTKSLSGASSLFSVGETNTENVTVSAFLQQQFGLNDRLYLNVAVRGDNNSAFGNQTGFIWYPSLSGSWVASEEDFFPELSAVSSLRLRAAYGQSGLRPQFRDAIDYYDPVSVRIGGVETPGLTLAGTGRADLKPERSREIEVGFDMGLFDDRLGLDFTYFDKRSEDALISRRLAPSLGLTTTAFENLGAVSNKGLEALIRATVLDREDVRVDFTLSGSRVANNLEQLGEGVTPILFGRNFNPQRHQEGFPLGGFWQKTVTYADTNGDGLLQLSEVAVGDTAVFLGQPFPKTEIAFSTSIELLSWIRLSTLFDYKGGHKVMNTTRFDTCSWEQTCGHTYDVNASLRDQASWMAYNVIERNVNAMLYLEDGDFVKWRELSLTLSAPQSFADRVGASGMSLTLSGRNLATWTDYRGFDPEVNQFGTSSFLSQDYYTQPPLRQWIGRIDINF